MRRSDAINELATALSKAQAKIRPATKDAMNPAFKSKYADLASVVDAYREPLAEFGLSLSQHPSSEGQRVIITTLLMHTSGQWLESDLAITAQQATPQSIGSAITYGRRYSAMSITGMASDDDDGNEADGRHPQKAQQPRQQMKSPQQAEPERYEATAIQKRELMDVASKMGIVAREDLAALSAACMGIELQDLRAAITEWAVDRKVLAKK